MAGELSLPHVTVSGRVTAAPVDAVPGGRARAALRRLEGKVGLGVGGREIGRRRCSGGGGGGRALRNRSGLDWGLEFGRRDSALLIRRPT